MTIAKKLTQIAENEQKVYDKGAADGAENVQSEFWSNYQSDGNRTAYSMAFPYQGWNDTTFKPKYNINAVGEAIYMFTGSRITNIAESLENQGVTLDTSRATNMNYFASSAHTKRLPSISLESATSTVAMFGWNSRLETIDSLIVAPTTVFSSNTFASCTGLKNITIEGTIANDISFIDCKNMSADSMISVFRHLSWEVPNLTVTFNKTAVNTAFNFDVDDETTWDYQNNDFVIWADSCSSWTIMAGDTQLFE